MQLWLLLGARLLTLLSISNLENLRVFFLLIRLLFCNPVGYLGGQALYFLTVFLDVAEEILNHNRAVKSERGLTEELKDIWVKMTETILSF